MPRDSRSVAEYVRKVVLHDLHPAVIAAIRNGKYSHSEETKAILIGEGLARETEYSWLEFTAEGEVVAACLESEIKDYASRFSVCEEPESDGPAADSHGGVSKMAMVVASIRDEAKARGGAT